MKGSNVAYLVEETFARNVYGVMERVETERKVFCRITSVSGSEWFEGGRNGINPEYRVQMFKYDYQGENIMRIGSVYYTIYRTYQGTPDTIELYLEKRKGNEQFHEPPIED